MAVALSFPLAAFAADEAPPKEAAKDAAANNLLKPTNDPESWTLELTDDGKGEMKADGDAIVFTTTNTTGTDWHVQAYQTGLDLENDKDYVVKFKAKADKPVEFLLVGQIHEPDWHEIGLHEQVRPTDEYKDYEYEFTAGDTSANKADRIGFVLGIDKGSVSIKDMTLTEK
jgi:hypothetical protein